MKAVLGVAAFLAGTALGFCGAAAQEGRRIALVIGNQAYERLAPLEKARADAAGYAGLLRAKGFEVALRRDLSAAEAEEALSAFVARIEKGDAAAFVFIGYGWSDGETNRLAFTDAALSADPQGAADSRGLLDRLAAAGAGLRIVVLDVRGGRSAEDPEAAALISGARPGRPRPGEFVVHAAGEGEEALDGLSAQDPDPRSLFARIFLEALEGEGSFLSAFKAAQAETSLLAEGVDHDQTPAYADGVTGDFTLENRARPEASAVCEGVIAPGYRCEAREGRAILTPLLPSTPTGAANALASEALAPRPEESLDALERTQAQALDLRRQLLLSLETYDRSLEIYDRDFTDLEITLQQGPALSLAFSPDERALLVGGQDGAWLLRLPSGVPLRSFSEDAIHRVAFHPDGQNVALLSAWGAVVVDLASGRARSSFSSNVPYSDLAFHPNSDELMMLDQKGRLRVQNLTTISESRFVSDGEARLSLYGRHLMSRSESGVVSFSTVYGSPSATQSQSLDWGLDADMSPSGELLAVATQEGEAVVWDLSRGVEWLRLKHGDSPLLSVAFSPGGRRLATSAQDRTVRIWSLPPPP